MGGDLKILITGGCGFVGHHFVEHFMANTDWDIVVMDKLNYSGRLDRLRQIGRFDDKRILVLTADLCRMDMGIVEEIKDCEYVLHLAAESHVENSIVNPLLFARNNVHSTVALMDVCRRNMKNLKRFFYFSTDEVFGPADEGIFFKEEDPHNPTNPYSASKSAGEMFVKAYRNTYGFPATITRTMNIFGERQNKEKFIPLVINSVLKGEEVQIHGDGQKAGSRFYIHARNVADAYLYLIKEGRFFWEDFHITGQVEIDNLTLAEHIAKIIRQEMETKDHYLNFRMVHFSESRPGHDLRYALDGGRMQMMAWKPPVGIWKSLDNTVKWYLENREWLD